MAAEKWAKRPQPRGHRANTQSSERLTEVINETLRFWRKHHLGYDQTKYVVERVRRRLALKPPRTRNRSVNRLDRGEVERLVQATYQHHSTYGLMIKVLFQTGARVAELVHLRVEDLRLDGDPPQIHITHAKRQADHYVPILPALAQELRTYLQQRQHGYLFESNRHTRYAARTVQSIVADCARTAGINKRVSPQWSELPGYCPIFATGTQ
jgi:integrase/recombinase XerD